MTVHLETTLGEKKEEPKFKIISSITDLGFNYDRIDLPFKEIKGTATITNTDFESELEGFLGNSSVAVKTVVSDYERGNPTIDVRRQIQSSWK